MTHKYFVTPEEMNKLVKDKDAMEMVVAFLDVVEGNKDANPLMYPVIKNELLSRLRFYDASMK